MLLLPFQNPASNFSLKAIKSKHCPNLSFQNQETLGSWYMALGTWYKISPSEIRNPKST